MPNFTAENEFLLTRFSDVWEYRLLHDMLFLLMQLAALMGNLLIVKVSTLDKNLHTFIYFFLRNLSIIDMYYISATVHKACVTFLIDKRTISVPGCATQVLIVHFCAFVEVLFFTSMAYDHYVAICQPLRYPKIMNSHFCVQMTLAFLLSGLTYSGFHTVNIFQLPYCLSNIAHQFFCDVKLSCSDTFRNEISIFISEMVIVVCCFVFNTRSYVYMFSTVLKFPTRGKWGKVFSTWVPYILVVTIFLTSGTAVYTKPTSTSHTIQDMVTSMFYSIVPPFLNLTIYSLRNKQIVEAIKNYGENVLFRKVIR